MLRSGARSCLLPPQLGSYCGRVRGHPLMLFKIKVALAVRAKAHCAVGLAEPLSTLLVTPEE